MNNKVSMKKFLLKVGLLLVIVLFFSSCMREMPVSPYEYYGLLLKAKEFFAFSSLVIDESTYYGQAISRIYYGYYYIARLVYINKSDGLDSSDHSNVWKKNGISLQDSYGGKLRSKRIKYDYYAHADKDDMIMDLKYIYDNRADFESLVKDFENTIQDNPFLDEECDEKCESEIKDIRKVHEELISSIKKVVD